MDCMEFMANISDKFFDLAFTDPPYGIGWDKEKESMSAGIRNDGSKRKHKTWKNRKPKKYKPGNYDNKPPDKKYFDELFRISKKTIICGGNYFTDKIPVSGGWIIWDKCTKMPSLSKAELCWTNLINHVEIFHYLWAGYLKQKPEDRIHVNQKPVDFYKWCLRKFAKPGWKVFDSHVGSGSIRIACSDMNLYFEGCEIHKPFFIDQEKRIENHILQNENYNDLWNNDDLNKCIYQEV